MQLSASASYRRDARVRRQAALAADPSLVPHGHFSTYTNHGCRCDKCAWENRVHSRRFRGSAPHAAKVVDHA